MAKKTGPTNPVLVDLLEKLKANSREVPLWKRVAKDLSKPARQRRVINLYKINKFAREGEIVLVPGKVLSLGSIEKKLTVAAFQFSKGSKEKIQKSNGTVLTIKELLTKNPSGKGIRILG